MLSADPESSRMNDHESPHDESNDAEAWIRFMAATLSAAPHAPVDKLAATADEALAEYRKRRRPEGVLSSRRHTD